MTYQHIFVVFHMPFHHIVCIQTLKSGIHSPSYYFIYIAVKIYLIFENSKSLLLSLSVILLEQFIVIFTSCIKDNARNDIHDT